MAETLAFFGGAVFASAYWVWDRRRNNLAWHATVSKLLAQKDRQIVSLMDDLDRLRDELNAVRSMARTGKE